MRAKECYCTNEVFLWPSITYQPRSLAQVMAASKPWQAIAPLESHEKIAASLDANSQSADTDKLVSIQTSGGKR